MVIAAFPWQYLRTAGVFGSVVYGASGERVQFPSLPVMSKKKNKPRKVFCLRKDNQYISWDGKTLTDKPSNALRTSKTMAERKYPGYVLIPFPEAYIQWHQAQKQEFCKPIYEQVVEEIKTSELT
jgi:uncharacterized protein (DUF3820 family)